MLKKFLLVNLLLLLIFIDNQKLSADVVSLQSNFVAGESTVVSHLNNDRTAIVNGVNNVQGCQTGGIQSAGQVKGATICQENMYSDADPALRTNEGASCAFVYTGYLPATTSGTLAGSIPAGTAYPVGYRIQKTSATARTFTASKWTWIDLDKNGTFNYIEGAIGAATPAVTANSLRLARVSTDTTQIFSVQDLRQTSCTSGPFNNIVDTTAEGSLGSILISGQYARRFSMAGTNPQGFVEGLYTSYDAVTTFRVTPGAAYINGKYRLKSADTVVPQTVGTPLTSGAGLDTGTIAASTTYYVYATADQPAVDTAGIIFSTSATAPTGVTNYRYIGSIRTDAQKNFTSTDTITVHGINSREIVGAWVNFGGDANIAVRNSFNFSSITRNAAGDYTIAWKVPFTSGDGIIVAQCGGNGAGFNCRTDLDSRTPMTPTTFRLTVNNTANAAVDSEYVHVMEIGEKT